jgi:hypothetical protein
MKLSEIDTAAHQEKRERVAPERGSQTNFHKSEDFKTNTRIVCAVRPERVSSLRWAAAGTLRLLNG